MLTKKNLKALGFKKDKRHGKAPEDSKDEKVYNLHNFEVTLFENKEDYPEIAWYEDTTRITFPGAYTLKDLKDLMFFKYGEDQYNKIVQQ